MTVAIRPVRVADAASLNACLDAIARERKYLGFIEAPPVAESVKFLEQFVKQGWPLLVACDGDTIVGWCDVSPMTREGFRHSSIFGMGLAAQFRGRGLGRKLAEATLAAADTLGLERIELGVFVDNARAIALYEKLGFVREGIRRRARKLDGVYSDILSMARVTPSID